MGDLSLNFSRHEFACKCGCGFDTADLELVELCEEVRAIEGAAVAVSSGCRCPAHNRREGGGKRSQHLAGRAADLYVARPRDVYAELCRRHPDEYGIGLYSNRVHVDSRTHGPARWEGST